MQNKAPNSQSPQWVKALKFFVKAFRNPEPARCKHSALRQLLLRPLPFELIGTLLQMFDIVRMQTPAPADNKGEDPFYIRWRTYNQDRTSRNVIATGRAAQNLLPALVLPQRDLSAEKLLVIGPRTVQELYQCWLFNYQWKNIHAIDLNSTNPKISVMNMENMEFADASFDSVLSSNTLTYAKDLGGCLKEVARVLKPGGRLSFTHSFYPEADTLPTMRIPGEKLMGYLREAGLRPYYHQVTEAINTLGGHQTAHHIAAQKLDPQNPPHDPIKW